MSITKQQIKQWVLPLAVFVAVLLGIMATPQARAEVIFLTRAGWITRTYPVNDAFSVGSTTNPGQVATTSIAKLNVTINPVDAFLGAAVEGWTKAFEVASTTTKGGTATSTADLFEVYRTGCFQGTATSSATPIKFTFSTVATGTASGYILWNYGTCS